MKKAKLLKEVKKILWEDWDPISVNDNEECINEYDGYASSIVKLLLNNRDLSKIEKMLLEHEFNNMYLSYPSKSYKIAARKLIELV